MAGKTLNDEAKTFIVQALACFDSPSTVAAAATKELGVTVTRQQVEKYDPTKRAGQSLSAKWRALFEQTRKAFLEDTASIAISHRAVRLRALQRMAEKAEERGNMPLAASLMEQAAKEVGDAYTNRQKLEHTGKDGGPIQAEAALDMGKLDDDQLASLAAIVAVAGSNKSGD